MTKTKRPAEACEAAETEEFGGNDDSLQLMLAKPVNARSRAGQPAGQSGRQEQTTKIDGVAVGRLVEAGGPLLVDFPGNPSSKPLPARSAAQILPEDSGAEVALLFENGDPLKPIIVGKMFSGSELSFNDRLAAGHEAELDGERVTLSAEKEIVLRCGKASITLTKAGKIIIKGAYLLNRSTGVNRIKGGSVQIN